MCLKTTGWVANSVDPVQTPVILIYSVCSGLSVPILMVNTVYFLFCLLI